MVQMSDSETYRYLSSSSYGADSGRDTSDDGSSGAAESESTPRKRRRSATSAADFDGALVPIQLKLPEDLCGSLKLLAFSNRETMSEIVLRCLTSSETVPKVWLSRRGA
jgi:hypothetical protein